MAAKKTKKTAKKTTTGNVAEAAYVVFARRFRPQTFKEVVGQETVTSALQHALRSARVAQAYIFAGPRGVGKTSLARIFAKALNCQNGTGSSGNADEPCNTCDSCLSISEGSALDVIEMDAATNRGINEIRELRDNVGLSPSQLTYKVYIVDEVHMLTTEAWNAFLKTLEEPPAHVRFVFATTEADKIPETILSRCQRFDLRRIGLKDIVRRLKQICEEEKIDADDSALERIAGISKGGLRDAESTLDQAVNLGEGKVTDDVIRQISGAAPDELIFELLNACADGKADGALTGASNALDAGSAPGDLLISLLDRLRGTLLLKTCGKDSSLLEGQSHLIKSYEALAAKLSEDQLLMLLQLFNAARRQVKDAAQARLPLEMALVRASRTKDLVDLGKLVSALESGGSGRFGNREGPRPNLQGHQAGGTNASVVAQPSTSNQTSSNANANSAARSTPPSYDKQAPQSVFVAAPSEALPENWEQLLTTVRPLSGGAMIVAALSHAPSIRLDLKKKLFEVGFAVTQGSYRQSFERPERLKSFKEALKEVYGVDLEVKLVRSENKPRAFRPLIRTQPASASQYQAVPEKKQTSQPANTTQPTPPPVQREEPRTAQPTEANQSAANTSTENNTQVEKQHTKVRLTPEEIEQAKNHPLVKMVAACIQGEVMDVRPRKISKEE